MRSVHKDPELNKVLRLDLCKMGFCLKRVYLQGEFDIAALVLIEDKEISLSSLGHCCCPLLSIVTVSCHSNCITIFTTFPGRLNGKRVKLTSSSSDGS